MHVGACGCMRCRGDALLTMYVSVCVCVSPQAVGVLTDRDITLAVGVAAVGALGVGWVLPSAWALAFAAARRCRGGLLPAAASTHASTHDTRATGQWWSAQGARGVSWSSAAACTAVALRLAGLCSNSYIAAESAGIQFLSMSLLLVRACVGAWVRVRACGNHGWPVGWLLAPRSWLCTVPVCVCVCACVLIVLCWGLDASRVHHHTTPHHTTPHRTHSADGGGDGDGGDGGRW